LRALPDLMILLKGLLAAVRSVFFTFCLLLLVIYIFAIAIKQLSDETYMGSKYFNGVPKSMYTLFVRGALLDDIAVLVEEVFDESPIVAGLLMMFILAASVTIMNMLVGVLCQVVTTVAAVEKEEMTVGIFESKLRAVAERLDQNHDGNISMEEFCLILHDPAAAKALQAVGVDPVGLIDYADCIFETEDGSANKDLSFGQFIEVVLDLRGACTATVKNVIDLRKYMHSMSRQTQTRLEERLERIEEGLDRMLGSKTRRSGIYADGRSTDPASPRSDLSSPGCSMTRCPSSPQAASVLSLTGAFSSDEDTERSVEIHPNGDVINSARRSSPKRHVAIPAHTRRVSQEPEDLVSLIQALDRSLSARFADFYSMLRSEKNLGSPPDAAKGRSEQGGHWPPTDCARELMLRVSGSGQAAETPVDRGDGTPVSAKRAETAPAT